MNASAYSQPVSQTMPELFDEEGESMTTEAQPLSADVRRCPKCDAVLAPGTMHCLRIVPSQETTIAALTSENDRLTRQLKLATDGLERIAHDCDKPLCDGSIARDTLAAVKEAQ